MHNTDLYKWYGVTHSENKDHTIITRLDGPFENVLQAKRNIGKFISMGYNPVYACRLYNPKNINTGLIRRQGF